MNYYSLMDKTSVTTFKQLRYNEGEPYLQPLNSDYSSIFEEFDIIGTLYLSSKKYSWKRK